MVGDGEEGKDLLGGLEETDVTQLIVSDMTYGDRSRESYTIPVFGGENGLWLV